MERLLLFYLFSGAIKTTEIDKSFIQNPLTLKLLMSYTRLSREGTPPTLKGLKLLYEKSEAAEEYHKLSAFITSVENVDKSIPPKEVLEELKRAYKLKVVEDKIKSLAENAMAKDVDNLSQELEELTKVVKSTKEVELTVLGIDTQDEIFSTESFIPTLTENGIMLSGLTVVAGRTGSSKSFFSINQLVHNWRSGHDGVFVSLEMSTLLVECRVLSLLSGVELFSIIKSVSPEKIRVPLSKVDAEKVRKVREELASPNTPNIYIVDNLFDADKIQATIESYAERGVKFFVIDYLNLINFKGSGGGWEAKSEYVKTLNRLCMERGIVMLLPSQANIEKDNANQVVFNTRGTSELLASATLAILLYVSEEALAAGLIEVIITKNRLGIEPTVALRKELHVATYTDLGLLNPL